MSNYQVVQATYTASQATSNVYFVQGKVTVTWDKSLELFNIAIYMHCKVQNTYINP